jgi:hypothetical protein
MERNSPSLNLTPGPFHLFSGLSNKCFQGEVWLTWHNEALCLPKEMTKFVLALTRVGFNINLTRRCLE